MRRESLDVCTNDAGYILNVTDWVEIQDSYISNANSDVILTVEFDVDMFKPAVGDVLTGSVCMVFDHGLFVDVYNRLKVFVPVASLPQRRPVLGDPVTVSLDGVRYASGSFNCFGKLVVVD
jgi:DNA-directed RNA polymerase subunit E'/Rpb7